MSEKLGFNSEQRENMASRIREEARLLNEGAQFTENGRFEVTGEIIKKIKVEREQALAYEKLCGEQAKRKEKKIEIENYIEDNEIKIILPSGKSSDLRWKLGNDMSLNVCGGWLEHDGHYVVDFHVKGKMLLVYVISGSEFDEKINEFKWIMGKSLEYAPEYSDLLKEISSRIQESDVKKILDEQIDKLTEIL